MSSKRELRCFNPPLFAEQDSTAASVRIDRPLSQRGEAVTTRRNGKLTAPVASAVPARALHTHVSHVINFDRPNALDEHVLRIDHIGRPGNVGKATSAAFYGENVARLLVSDLVKIQVLGSCKHLVHRAVA